MITKIDITKFGLFRDYSWNNSIGKDIIFRRLNIIYGRNYSGKTTLSRIFKCMQDNLVHKHYTDCGFTVSLSNTKTVSSANLNEFELDNKLRVYNTDFVRENLSWLHNDTDGSILPFTILGSKNIELEKKIAEIDDKLGSIEEGKGLSHQLNSARREFAIKIDKNNSLLINLDEQLRKRANDKIKSDSNLFIITPTNKSYTITNIKSEIGIIEKDVSKYLLDGDTVDNYKKLLKENALLDIDLLSESRPNFAEYYFSSDELLTRKIKPSEPIIELINDNLLQEWVRVGIDRHKGKRPSCGFCGNPINSNLWDKLDAHFSKESEELRSSLKDKISLLQQSQKSLSQYLKLEKDLFYKYLHPKYELLLKQWNSIKESYNKTLDQLIFDLKAREKDIFRERELTEIVDVSESIQNLLKEFNALINTHNNKTKTLSNDQIKARKDLRFAHIAQFLIDIDYFKKTADISDGISSNEEFKKTIPPIKSEIDNLLEEKRILISQAKDESRGAELINQHLSHFFGHEELKLVAEGETPNMKFKINREGIQANNLSEGECSLISFCYFIAKMEDELKDGNNNRKLIIYIDDPISSLDTNHIFFMFSLIESVIAKPKKYGQLFISTHNLDFLKYLKRLTCPKFKLPSESKEKSDINHFIIERKNKSYSHLKLAPNYLKDYFTEFNYLFKQIYHCSIAEMDDIASQYQYSFGNNMRKFLEAYLFYKYPSHKITPDQKLQKYFDHDSITINLINRVTNEYSHIGEHFERGMEPIDIEEIKKISKVVIDKIKTTDVDQYEALLESIQ